MIQTGLWGFLIRHYLSPLPLYWKNLQKRNVIMPTHIQIAMLNTCILTFQLGLSQLNIEIFQKCHNNSRKKGLTASEGEIPQEMSNIHKQKAFSSKLLLWPKASHPLLVLKSQRADVTWPMTKLTSSFNVSRESQQGLFWTASRILKRAHGTRFSGDTTKA